MKRKILGFLRDKRGAFAMQFALLITPLIGCTGLAIDGGRMFLARYELASALDAAALAVGSTFGTDEELNELAQRYVERNFRVPGAGVVSLTLDIQPDVITLGGRVDMNTYFMPLFGVPVVNVAAESEVRRGGADVEVALALDITGSMAGARIVALKDAANDLIDIVVSDVQEPYYSKISIIPWANSVTTGPYLSAVREDPVPAKLISAATWRNGTARSVTAATWRDGSTRSISGVTRANPAVVTSSSHGYSNGDIIRITGVSGMTQLNNNIYRVSDVTTNTFRLRNVSTNAYISSSSFSTYSSGGTIQKCFDETCAVRVTASSHALSNGDFVHISGVSGMTQINNTNSNRSWTVSQATSTTFVLTGSTGPSYSNYSSGGSSQRCFDSDCSVQITSNAHGFSNDEHIVITGTNGMTQINNGGTVDQSWQATAVTTNNFRLADTYGPGMSNYTSGGNIWCTYHGCQYIRYTAANNSTVRVRQLSNCITERVGAEAYTDAPPETAKVGFHYALTSHAACFTSNNQLVPLTSNKTTLHAAINSLPTNGYTAGQIGLAWGWYMVSPNWGHLWADEINRPAPYESEDLVKVVVLMTDGEFNVAHCNGVVGADMTDISNNMRINCNSTNGPPFAQATQLCNAIKGQSIVIYTIGFGVGTTGTVPDFLTACASEPSYAHLTSTSEELQQAFRSIARSITLLRLSR